jgi:hypothetical protein
MGAAPREDHQPGAYRACQSSQAGEAAAIIEFAEFEEFRYSEPQWSELKAVVRHARLDVDQIRRTMEFAASRSRKPRCRRGRTMHARPNAMSSGPP